MNVYSFQHTRSALHMFFSKTMIAAGYAARTRRMLCPGRGAIDCRLHAVMVFVLNISHALHAKRSGSCNIERSCQTTRCSMATNVQASQNFTDASMNFCKWAYLEALSWRGASILWKCRGSKAQSRCNDWLLLFNAPS